MQLHEILQAIKQQRQKADQRFSRMGGSGRGWLQMSKRVLCAVMEMLHCLGEMVVTELHAFAKSHQTAFKWTDYITCKLHLNRAVKKKKKSTRGLINKGYKNEKFSLESLAGFAAFHFLGVEMRL